MYICLYIHVYTLRLQPKCFVINEHRLWAPGSLVGRAHMGRALVGAPGLLWAKPLSGGPLLASVGFYGRGPCGPGAHGPGPHGPSPYRRGPSGPGPYGVGPYGSSGLISVLLFPWPLVQSSECLILICRLSVA